MIFYRKTDYVYIGWAQKQDDSRFSTDLIDDLKMQNIIDTKNITEYKEITMEELMKQKAENYKKKKLNPYRVGEKIIKNNKLSNKT